MSSLGFYVSFAILVTMFIAFIFGASNFYNYDNKKGTWLCLTLNVIIFAQGLSLYYSSKDMLPFVLYGASMIIYPITIVGCIIAWAYYRKKNSFAGMFVSLGTIPLIALLAATLYHIQNTIELSDFWTILLSSVGALLVILGWFITIPEESESKAL